MTRPALPSHPYWRHPLTGLPLQAVGFKKNGNPIWPIMGASEDATDEGADKDESGKDATQVVESGFPENTAVADMTPDQKLAYWMHHAKKHERLWKETEGVNGREVEDLRAKAKRLEEIEAANATDQEKAVKAARDEARAEALKEATPRIVSAEFRAAAAGRIPPEQLAAILEPLDMSKFLDDKGEVDAAKVTKFIDGVAPKKPEPKRFPDLGQGKRTGGTGPSVSAGRDLYQSQQKKTPAAS